MKQLPFLINTFFVILFSKSVVFANELQSEINYLVELSKNNISQANSLISLLKLLTGFFAVAFISIIGFIVFKLFDLSKQISANKEVLQTIKEHGDRLTTLAEKTEEIRNQIRDQSLKAKGITDVDYGKFLQDVLNWVATPLNMDMVKNFIWNLFKPDEYEEGLKKLRKIFSDTDVPTLMEKVKKQYYEIFKENIDNRTLLTWIYEIKEHKRNINELLYEEAKKTIDYERVKEKFWGELVSGHADRVKAAYELMRALEKESSE